MTCSLFNSSSSVLACPTLTRSKLPPRNTPIWRKPVSDFSAIHAQRRICELIDLHRQQIPYEVACSWQKELVKEKKAQIEEEGGCTDTLIVLQHPPAFTLGTGSSEDNINFGMENAPFDIYRTERGEVTYHGHGQEIVIRVLSSTFPINASRIEGLTGVWVGNRKVAAVGIRVSQWITCHGLALNVTTNLTPFNWIVPCGIRDRQFGSIKGLLKELDAFIGEETADLLHLDGATLIHNTHKSLVQEFSNVFELECLNKTMSVPECCERRL